MKNLVASLLALGSLTVFAQEAAVVAPEAVTITQIVVTSPQSYNITVRPGAADRYSVHIAQKNNMRAMIDCSQADSEELGVANVYVVDKTKNAVIARATLLDKVNCEEFMEVLKNASEAEPVVIVAAKTVTAKKMYIAL